VDRHQGQVVQVHGFGGVQGVWGELQEPAGPVERWRGAVIGGCAAAARVDGNKAGFGPVGKGDMVVASESDDERREDNDVGVDDAGLCVSYSPSDSHDNTGEEDMVRARAFVFFVVLCRRTHICTPFVPTEAMPHTRATRGTPRQAQF
jgi:hypothetical protein